MKKKLSIVTSAALLLSLGFTMAGCGKSVAKISPEIEGEYSASLTQNVIQANSANYSYDFGSSDGAGHVIVTEEAYNAITMTTVTTYKVYDLVNKQWTNISSTTPLSVLDEGVFYTANVSIDPVTSLATPDGTYTLFSTAGYFTPSAVKGSFNESVFYAEDGSRWYVNVDGELVQEMDPFAMILVNDNTYKVGKYYINYTSDGYNIFDKKGKFQDALNWEYTFGVTEGMSGVEMWSAGYNLFMQFKTELPIFEDDYDVIISDVKYNLDTYSYSIKNGKVKEVKNFDYYVENNISYYEGEDVIDYAILEVREIKNERLSETALVQSFDDKGKVYVDIQDIVPGATDIDFSEFGYTMLRDYAGFTYIYDGKECVLTIPAGSTDVNFADNGVAYYVIGGTLYVYDLDSNSVITSVNKVVDADTNYNGNIVYSTYDDIAMTTTYSIYDVDMGSVTYSRTLATTETKVSGDFASNYVCISNTYTDPTTSLPVTKYSIVFPDSNISEITGVDSASLVDTYYVEATHTEYTVFMTSTATAGGYDPTGLPLPASNIVSYHIGTEVYPYIK